MCNKLPQSPRLGQRVAERVPADLVNFWLSRLDVDTFAAHRSHLFRFMKYLHKQKGCEELPQEAPAQKSASLLSRDIYAS